jgi:hypothetical protein
LKSAWQKVSKIPLSNTKWGCVCLDPREIGRRLQSEARPGQKHETLSKK